MNSQSKKSNLFHYPRVSPSNHPLTKKPEDSKCEIAMELKEKGHLQNTCILSKTGSGPSEVAAVAAVAT